MSPTTVGANAANDGSAAATGANVHAGAADLEFGAGPLISTPARQPEVSGPVGEEEPFIATPAIGALVYLNGDRHTVGAHFCTATVVASADRDLLIAAAHCVAGVNPDTMAFIPGYDGGSATYGVWPITQVFVDAAWTSSQQQDNDFAFLVTARSADGTTIEQKTGAYRIGFDQPAGEEVEVSGYPDGASAPIACSNVAKEYSPTQLEFDCGGYTTGTSGSPLVAGGSGAPVVIGVIGGHQLGGYTASISYAARLLDSADALYREAASSAAAAAG